MLLAIVGYIMIIVIVILLLKGITTPIVTFIIVPLLAVVVAGFSLTEINEFVAAGIKTTSSLSILFIFSVTYFGLMSDAGMFDGIINFLVKKAGKNIIAIAVATAIIGILSHLDGATITTVLVTVPAMLPIYKKLNIRPQLLLLIVAAAMGVMNLLPWGGPTARAAVVLDMDVNELWKMFIPIQIFGVFLTIGIAVLGAIYELKRGAGIVVANTVSTDTEVEVINKEDEKILALKRPKLTIFNIILTLILLAVLIAGILPVYLAFMIATSIALVVNYPKVKDQTNRIKAHAPAALSVSVTILAASVMIGVLSKSGMLEAMTQPLLSIVPTSIARHLHIVMGLFALPLGTVLGTDSYFYTLMPIAIGVGDAYGVSPIYMAISMSLGKNLGLMISPLVPATYLATGLAGVELKDHLKYSFMVLWAASILEILAGVIFGIIPL